MTKRILKATLCILLIIALMAGSSAATWWITERSVLYNEHTQSVKQNGMTFLGRYCTIEDYYNKLPDSFDPNSLNKSTELELLLAFSKYTMLYNDNNIVVRATYKGTKHNPELHMRAEFRFDNEEVLWGCPPGYSKIKDLMYFKSGNSYAYYTAEEYMHNYYKTGYEKGEEYLLILQYDNQIVRSHYSKGMYLEQLDNVFCINKLSGEYPSIKMFPGPVEYDATYFGAETKYVTADEFVELFMKAVNEYSVANGFS